jgi:hypothetical protein
MSVLKYNERTFPKDTKDNAKERARDEKGRVFILVNAEEEFECEFTSSLQDGTFVFHYMLPKHTVENDFEQGEVVKLESQVNPMGPLYQRSALELQAMAAAEKVLNPNLNVQHWLRLAEMFQNNEDKLRFIEYEVVEWSRVDKAAYRQLKLESGSGGSTRCGVVLLRMREVTWQKIARVKGITEIMRNSTIHQMLQEEVEEQTT